MSEISEKQLEANRQNAKLGGVKTDEGKAISRFNALKHGLLSKEVLLKTENQEDLEELGKSLRQEFKPVCQIELLFVEKLIAEVWRLKRAFRIEKEMIDDDCKEKEDYVGKKTTNGLGQAFSYDFVNNDTYGKFTRYYGSIERSVIRTLHKLQKLQAQRESKSQANKNGFVS